MKQTLLIFFSFLWGMISHAQNVSGTVSDTDGNPLPGVNIKEQGTANGSITDFDGKYTIDVQEGATLIFSFVGFETKNVPVNGQSEINITLVAGESLDDVILVGSRAPARSNTTVALPIDVVGSQDLVNTGQATFDKALQYRIPSFNTVQTPVNDATSLLDPYEIRNMGPSRTLILINGKRKNLSALLYTQTSPGRGETGADISAIPQDAIKRVEILRDGASAQYGSDAIAGVMNIVLKDEANKGSATIRSGVTIEGDGEMFGIAVNNGSTIGDDKGFINYTIDLSKVNLANRPGTVDADGEFIDFVRTNPDAVGEYLDAAGTLNGIVPDGTNADVLEQQFEDYKTNSATEYQARLAEINQANADARPAVDEFLNRNPDANNINGSPETAAAKFLINGGYDVSDESELYFNAAYVYKNVNSFANYRTPYWRSIESFPYLGNFFPGSNPLNQGSFNDIYGNTFQGNGYDGYVPTFDGLLSDYNGTVGFRTKKNEWNIDLSFTTGGNLQTYKVRNSHNRNEVFTPSFDPETGSFTPIRLYQENSQIDFDPGGTRFSHNVGNIDISRILNDYVSIAAGAEFRTETFEIIEGEVSSYEGGGADSFAGNTPENSGKFNRYNIGGYLDVAVDITEDFLINGTARVEEYSDFGNAFVWKVSSRYKFLDDKYTIRASASTGFRAPTLHQIFTQKAQFSFIPGQGIQVGGLVNNVSPQARLLGIDKLDAEKSTNITFGIGAKILSNLSLTVDYYNIAVEDRIVLGTEIGPTQTDLITGENIGTTPLDDVLRDNNLSDVSFFSNAIDTRTSGIDVVLTYNNLAVGDGTLGFNLSGNYTIQNEREGDVKNPDIVANSGQSVVNETQEALFFTSRPITKWILGADYSIGKFNFILNNTYFGKTTFKQQGLDNNLRTEFIPKVVTDLAVNFNFTEKITLALNVNNILNVLPEWEFVAENAAGEALLNDPAAVKTNSNLITFNQRYSQMTYDGYHFSQLGTMFNLSLNYQF